MFATITTAAVDARRTFAPASSSSRPVSHLVVTRPADCIPIMSFSRIPLPKLLSLRAVERVGRGRREETTRLCSVQATLSASNSRRDRCPLCMAHASRLRRRTTVSFAGLLRKVEMRGEETNGDETRRDGTRGMRMLSTERGRYGAERAESTSDGERRDRCSRTAWAWTCASAWLAAWKTRTEAG